MTDKDFYEEISYDEFIKFIDNIEELSDFEISTISSLLNKCELTSDSSNKSVIIVKSFMNPSQTSFKITKSYDDWFVANTRDGCFKCDQLDGLIYFLKIYLR